MVALKINLADIGGRPVSHTRAVFLSAPAHRPSTTVDGRVVTTTPYPVNVVNGLATVTVEPGELVVEIRSGLADSTPKRVTVPGGVEEVTLQDLLESAYVYDPPVVSLVKQYLDGAKAARDTAVAAAESVGHIADDVAQIAEDRAAAELARNEARDSAEDASESRGLAAVAAVSAGDSSTLAGQHETAAAGHASNALSSATAADQSESAAAQHEVNAETAADLAVQTAAGIQDVAADAAQVAADRQAVESAASTVAADRQTVTDARGVVVTAKDDVEQVKIDVHQVKSSIENTATLVDQTLAQYGAQFVTEREASQQAVTDATAQAQRAEDAAEGIIAGAVIDGSVTTPKLADAAVTKAKTSPGVQTSLDKADTSVQEGDSRLTNARPPTAHSHAVADVTGLQGALDGKAATSHSHTEAQVTGLTAKLATKADLDGAGKVLAAQLPAVALTDFLGAVATQAAMLALAGQRGDWCTRTDRGTDWQLIAEPSSILANWREKTYPASPVSSVNGRQGAVDTSSADITDATPVGRASMRAADQAAGRAAIGAAAAAHTHTIADVDGLQVALDTAGGTKPQVKMLAYCGGGPYVNSVPSSGTATSFGARVPIMLPVDTTRWRVRMRNYNGYNAANGSQPLTGSRIAVGKHALNALGNSSGVFTAPTVRTVHNTAFTIPNTTSWWTSPWITAPADQMTANEPYLLGWSATSTAQQIAGGIGEAWLFTGSGADATDATKTNGTMGTGNSTHGCPLDIVIEYECTTARPALLGVGDSIMEGLTGYTGTSFASSLSVPWYQSYLHQWANSCGAVAVNLAQWGTTTSQWLPTVTDRWSRADLTNGKFAGAVIALGSNDASASVPLATYQANMALIVGKVRALIEPGAPIYLVNVIGRNFSGTPETLRVSYNDWLATCPLGVKGVIDAAGSMTTPGFTPTMMAHLTMDGVHPNMTGNAHLAGLVGSRVQL
ncbi:hypothetical protein QM716_28530 [Rhodococcus sp. IEGM 1409]|uniref:GDSL-type esterase/lipase family protein n=1 Tax=Rhodococcus sp. IEGM 1409 TaxID=3047082 RepID=UPI0024B79252|nr:GDSL-type esterase/lipase family protein [Rhodococcus sp. IEGM 1409]MDI9903817.1 hypothetical protein [Rhodococcus sp. IEGM 1409]